MIVRQRPAGDANEHEMLTGWLDWLRATVRVKCEGLSDIDARRALLPSSPTMSISGVISHLRWVEYGWFEVSFQGVPDNAPSTDADPHARWRVDAAAPLSAVVDEYETQCQRSRDIVAGRELDEMEAFAPPGLELVSLRWILGHMIEETARHLGHIDALRELADGATGS